MEQSYKQVKHLLGWSDYQVRSDLAIRRHWELVCLAFSFCWWAYGRLPIRELADTENDLPPIRREGEKAAPSILLAGGAEGSKGVVGALCNHAILEGILRDAPTAGAKSAA